MGRGAMITPQSDPLHKTRLPFDVALDPKGTRRWTTIRPMSSGDNTFGYSTVFLDRSSLVHRTRAEAVVKSTIATLIRHRLVLMFSSGKGCYYFIPKALSFTAS